MSFGSILCNRSLGKDRWAPFLSGWFDMSFMPPSHAQSCVIEKEKAGKSKQASASKYARLSSMIHKIETMQEQPTALQGQLGALLLYIVGFPSKGLLRPLKYIVWRNLKLFTSCFGGEWSCLWQPFRLVCCFECTQVVVDVPVIFLVEATDRAEES